jgi:hypothetical protein
MDGLLEKPETIPIGDEERNGGEEEDDPPSWALIKDGRVVDCSPYLLFVKILVILHDFDFFRLEVPFKY